MADHPSSWARAEIQEKGSRFPQARQPGASVRCARIATHACTGLCVAAPHRLAGVGARTIRIGGCNALTSFWRAQTAHPAELRVLAIRSLGRDAATTLCRAVARQMTGLDARAIRVCLRAALLAHRRTPAGIAARVRSQAVFSRRRATAAIAHMAPTERRASLALLAIFVAGRRADAAHRRAKPLARAIGIPLTPIRLARASDHHERGARERQPSSSLHAATRPRAAVVAKHAEALRSTIGTSREDRAHGSRIRRDLARARALLHRRSDARRLHVHRRHQRRPRLSGHEAQGGLRRESASARARGSSGQVQRRPQPMVECPGCCTPMEQGAQRPRST